MDELTGIKVALVEDESTVALVIEDMLQDLGCELVGSVASLSRAQQLVDSARFDIAVLDVNLRGEAVFPVAYSLVERGIPFLFSTGYGQRAIPSDLADRPAISKPFSIETLAAGITSALTCARRSGEGCVARAGARSDGGML